MISSGGGRAEENIEANSSITTWIIFSLAFYVPFGFVTHGYGDIVVRCIVSFKLSGVDTI